MFVQHVSKILDVNDKIHLNHFSLFNLGMAMWTFKKVIFRKLQKVLEHYCLSVKRQLTLYYAD